MSLEDSWRGAGISYGCLHWCLLRSRLFCGVPCSASFVCMNSAGITEVCWSFEMHSLLALRALLGSFFLLSFCFFFGFASLLFQSHFQVELQPRTQREHLARSITSLNIASSASLFHPFFLHLSFRDISFAFVSQQRAVSSARKRVTLNIPLILFPYLPTAVRTFSPQFESMRADVRQS